VRWYRKAAEQDDEDAQFALGYCLEHGRGVGRDIAQARQWYEKAADQGHWRAANVLARLQAKPKAPRTEPEHATERSYWVIAPYFAEAPEEWQQVWNFDLANNTISIGWEELDDITSLDEEELRAAIDRTWSEATAIANGHTFRMLWAFYHKIKVGDIVLARQGTKKLAAVGTVTRTAYFDPHKPISGVGDWFTYGNHLDVRWHDSPRGKKYPKIVFSIATLSQISEEKFRALVREGEVGAVEGPEEEDGVEGGGQPIRQTLLATLRLLLQKGAIDERTKVKFSTFRKEAKAAGGIESGYDALEERGWVGFAHKEPDAESGPWYLWLTAEGRAVLEAESAAVPTSDRLVASHEPEAIADAPETAQGAAGEEEEVEE
jgi:hypothetical protein